MVGQQARARAEITREEASYELASFSGSLARMQLKSLACSSRSLFNFYNLSQCCCC